MSIKDWGEKIKLWGRGVLGRVRGEETTARYYTAAIIILVGLSSFGLGRLSILDENRQPIIIENDSQTKQESAAALTAGAAVSPATVQSAAVASSAKGQMSIIKSAPLAPGGKIVASKTGTKYYFPWCGGTAKIANANKIWFNSETDARAKGYQPAANCKGLK